MAMSKQSESISEETEEYLFICGICLYNFDNPKALPCLHTFCCECIRQWAAHNRETKPNQPCNVSVACPNCRRDAHIPAGGVEQLPTNFYIPHLPKKTSVKLPSCMSCDNPKDTKSDIVGRCKDCGWLCKSCLASHKSLKGLKKHVVLELENLRLGKASPVVLASTASISKKCGPKYGVWKCEHRLGKFKEARCVAVAPNGDIAVTECNEKGKVHAVSQDGQPKFVLDTTIGLLPGQKSKPYGVAVDSRGFFYVTNSTPLVHVYNEAGKYVFLFKAVLPENCGPVESDLVCMGIAVSDEQNIFIGEITCTCLSEHTSNGTHIRSFKTYDSLYPRFITSSGNTIAMSKLGGSSVLLTDLHGEYTKYITSPSVEFPLNTRDVYLYGNRELLVVNSGEKWSVLRYSLSGNYLGCITDGVLSDSCGICTGTFDGAEKLLIASKNTITMFRWVNTS